MTRKSIGTNGRMVNDFFHDLSAGLFPGAVAGVWLVERAVDAGDPGRGFLVASSAGGVWLVLVVALTILVTTGLIRLRYWRLNVRSGFMETKQQMAVVKHAAFVMVQVAAALALAAL